MMGTPAPQIFQHISETRKQRYQILHGYYHGISSKVVDDKGKPLEQLHAVQLTENCFATGKYLSSLNLEKAGNPVEVVKHSDGTETTPYPTLVLMAGDTLILHGSSEQIESAENLIIGG